MVEDIAEFWGKHLLGRGWRKRLATLQKERIMDPKTVRKIEKELEQAIAEVVIVRNKKWKYPLLQRSTRCR